jgi:hypothetical protein
MGFSMTGIATSQVYRQDQVEQLRADFGVPPLRLLDTTWFDDAASMDGSSEAVFSLCSLENGSIIFGNDPGHLMRHFNLAAVAQQMERVAFFAIEEHAMVMVAEYFQSGQRLRKLIDVDGDMHEDERSAAYVKPDPGDSMSECMHIIELVIGQSFYSIEADREVSQFLLYTV